MTIGANNIQEAVKNLEVLKSHKPYKYGSKWFVAIIKGEAHAFRSIKSLEAKAVKSKVFEFEMITFGE